MPSLFFTGVVAAMGLELSSRDPLCAYVETAAVASGHCIARVHHEIEQHLLKLHSVAEDDHSIVKRAGRLSRDDPHGGERALGEVESLRTDSPLPAIASIWLYPSRWTL